MKVLLCQSYHECFWTASPSTVPYNEDGTFSSNFPLTNGANPVQTRTYNYDRNAITRSFNTLQPLLLFG
ncbi:hypothetical protein NXV16_20600, partial [Bacteroides fragilis]|nr:hypothetical protein [Bacteroides fragilis]